MRSWNAEAVAAAAEARLVTAPGDGGGPDRVIIDSREAGPGALFVGLPGRHVDGGRFAGMALAAGAWGVLIAEEHAAAARAAPPPGVVLSSPDPLLALQRMASAWRRELGAVVIGVTGSTGKTSTKDLLLAVLAPHRRTVASRANFNTEIGLPLEILGAPAGTEILVLEMAMRGPGQIAELAAIAQPDVGVIVNVGPVHLELLGSIEAIAAAKAELIAGLPAGGTAVVPAGERLLDPHLRPDVRTVRFGPGGDVELRDAGEGWVDIDCQGERLHLEVAFTQSHLRHNLLAVAAAARAAGVQPSSRVELAFTPGRGQQIELPSGVTLLDDSYNANPLSMRAALDSLAAVAGAGRPRRRLAVLGDMLELGPEGRRFHEEIGDYAAGSGVDVLVTVGPLAAAMGGAFPRDTHAVADAGEAAAVVTELVAPGDVVLVKGSNAVGLQVVCGALAAADG